MHWLSRIVRTCRDLVWPPPSGRHHAGAPTTLQYGDGLDDVRADLADPIRRLLAQRPDLAHRADELTGVR